MTPEKPKPVQLSEPVDAPSADHLARRHAFPTPVVMAGLRAMVGRGAAPRDILEDPTGKAFHVWAHERGENGVGGSPSHTHASSDKPTTS